MPSAQDDGERGKRILRYAQNDRGRVLRYAFTCAFGERADDIRPYDKTGVRLDYRVIPTKAQPRGGIYAVRFLHL